MPKITEISAKKMKFKMRLVAGNGNRPEALKNRHVKFYNLISKIHEKNSKQHTSKTPLFFLGGGGGSEMNKSQQHRRGVTDKKIRFNFFLRWLFTLTDHAENMKSMTQILSRGFEFFFILLMFVFPATILVFEILHW